jgi:hypothetical protein
MRPAGVFSSYEIGAHFASPEPGALQSTYTVKPWPGRLPWGSPMSEPERRSSWTFLLVGLVLLVTLAALVIAFVPLTSCSDCQLLRETNRVSPRRPRSLEDSPCTRCNDTGEITLLNNWLKSRDPFPDGR